jgi:eukaryotic-like serine/threonine-protein kinase
MERSRHSGQDDQLSATLSIALSRAVGRYWAERANGNQVSVDELLETTPGTPEHDLLRASVIQTISSQVNSHSQSEQSGVPSGEHSQSIWRALAGVGPMPSIEGYDLVACLGRGGMGAVFEGYQQSTGRRVAVKFMLDAFGASDAARKRFEREVEVVARLQHPGIVSIVDSGVRSGRYFYAMEYVEGRVLDKALIPGQCDWRKAVDLMAQVCDAVDYAHQRGVLHRDLKPGNIVVDGSGKPRLLDFGLAKVFDPDSSDGESHGHLGMTVSSPGQLIGTVAYMSPEQAEGRHSDTSVRTDVYALGVITYELLTGRLPVRKHGSLQEILKRIIEEDPPPTSSVRSGLTRDLDAVILKSLDKSPQRRYATAGEFAADLRHVLAGEPVTARRASAAGRAVRWVRRNRAISTVTAGAIATLAIVSSLLISQILHESAVAAYERDLAQANFDRLRMILESADPERSPGGATVLQLLDTATQGLEDSPLENDMAEAQIREVLGGVYRKLGEYEKARDHQLRALAIRRGRAGQRDDPEVAEALHNLAATLWWDGKYEQASQLYAESLAMRRRLHPGDHPDVAFSLTHLAACHLRMRNYREARQMYEEALAMRRRLYGNEHEEIAMSLNNLAKCMLDAGDVREAEELHREALNMIRRIRGDSSTGTASASQNLGECLLRRAIAEELAENAAEAKEAARSARDAFALALRIRTDTFPSGHHLIAASLDGVARAELQLGNIEVAGELAREAVEEYRRTRRDDHPDIGLGLKTLGRVLMAEGKIEAAIEAFEQSLKIAESVRPPDEVLIASLQGRLGLALATTEEYARGEQLLLTSLEELRSIGGDHADDTILAHRYIVQFYQQRNQPERAELFLRGARLNR